MGPTRPWWKGQRIPVDGGQDKGFPVDDGHDKGFPSTVVTTKVSVDGGQDKGFCRGWS
jgi:hypothetical protein